jgi:hypothetical protein
MITDQKQAKTPVLAAILGVDMYFPSIGYTYEI